MGDDLPAFPVFVERRKPVIMNVEDLGLFQGVPRLPVLGREQEVIREISAVGVSVRFIDVADIDVRVFTERLIELPRSGGERCSTEDANFDGPSPLSYGFVCFNGINRLSDLLFGPG